MAKSADEGKALVKENYGDLLTCTICLETFKVPKYLPCLHTFCETCIHTYILSSMKEDKPQTFKCPICRQPVQTQKDQGKPETWAKSLPGNHFVVSLIDRRELKRDEKRCSACESNNKSTKAMACCTVCEEAYCDACETSHKSFKATRGHKVVQIKDMREEKDVSLSGFVECNEHPQKTIEVYCINHSKPCCALCATVHHRRCEQVVSIDKALHKIKGSEKVTNLVKRLQESNEHLEDVIQKRKQSMQRFEMDTDNALSQIGTLKENLIVQVERLEEKLRDEINNSKKNLTIQMDDEITELSSLKSNLFTWKNIFDACIAEGSELHCLVKMEEILENLPRVDKRVSKLKTDMKDFSMSFEPNNLSDITSLGRFSLKGSAIKCPKGMRKVNFHSGKVKQLFTIDISNGKRISGVFLNGCILLSDYNSSRIIKYDDNGTQIGELTIPATPSDITKNDDLTVAVASDSTQIYLINIEKLSLSRTVITDDNVYGLNFVDNEYIASHYSNAYILWLDSAFKRIRIENSEEQIYFVCGKSKNDYVYKEYNSSIQHVSPKGIFSYVTDQFPFTYAVDFEDNIYVGGQAFGVIHQLTPTCKLIRVIPISTFAKQTGKFLWVLRFEENSNKFLLTFQDSGKVLICEID